MRRLAAHPLLALAAAVLLSGCAGAPRPSTPPVETPAYSAAVRWVRDSAEHRALVVQAYRLAAERLEELTGELAPGTWAVSLDADETVISNLAYQLDLEEAGRGFSSDSWRAWVAERRATPLLGAREFLQAVHAMGGRVVVVTNRDADQQEHTEAVLAAHGLAYDAVLSRPPESGDKNPRWRAVEEGTAGLPPLRLVMWVGDNIQDFPGLDQSFGPGHAAWDEIGRRFILVPNPMYGSWE